MTPSPFLLEPPAQLSDQELERLIHEAEVANLYHQRSITRGQDRIELDNLINQTVIKFNEANPRGEAYFDLHLMTKNGAVWYVAQKVEWMRIHGINSIQLETGRGNRSVKGIPVIREALMEEYGRREDTRIEMDRKNPGVLVLRLCDFAPGGEDFEEMFPKL